MGLKEGSKDKPRFPFLCFSFPFWEMGINPLPALEWRSNSCCALFTVVGGQELLTCPPCPPEARFCCKKGWARLQGLTDLEGPAPGLAGLSFPCPLPLPSAVFCPLRTL